MHGAPNRCNYNLIFRYFGKVNFGPSEHLRICTRVMCFAAASFAHTVTPADISLFRMATAARFFASLFRPLIWHWQTTPAHHTINVNWAWEFNMNHVHKRNWHQLRSDIIANNEHNSFIETSKWWKQWKQKCSLNCNSSCAFEILRSGMLCMPSQVDAVPNLMRFCMKL